MEQGYFSNRISENEQRIATLKGELITRKLSIQSLEEENERLFEAMNKQTHSIDIDKDNKDMEIAKLKRYNRELQRKIETLKKGRKSLLHELEHTKKELGSEIEYLRFKLLVSVNRNDDTIYAENFGEHNIFEELLGES